MAKGVLRVVANPYNGGHRALDHRGRAAVHVPHLVHSAKGLTSRTHFVGATLDEKAMAEPDRHVGWDGAKPVMVPTLALTHDEGAVEEIVYIDPKTRQEDTNKFRYYARKLQDGDLLPADEETAIRTNTLAQRPKVDKQGKQIFDGQGRLVTEAYFVPASEALAKAKALAIKQFTDEHGFEPACAAKAKPADAPAEPERLASPASTTPDPKAAPAAGAK